MNQIPHEPNSLWRNVTLEDFPAMKHDTEADVTVVGAGITGITTAYLLAKRGYRVILLEAGKILNGTTGDTTAKVTAQHGLIYHDLIQTVGEEEAKHYYQANQDALQLIDEIRQEHQIDCNFTYQDAYVYATTEETVKEIEKEAKAYEKLGINGGLTKETDLPYSITAAIKMNNQAQFHPVQYLSSLIEYLNDTDKVSIFENTRAVDINKGNRPEVVTANGHSAFSDHVVLASHFPFKDDEGFYFARLHIERSYTVAVRPDRKIPEGMYISTDEPKRSIRSAVDERGEPLLLIGGEGHTTGQQRDTMAPYERLVSFADHHFKIKEIPHRWSSQDQSTLDGMPYIGPITKENPNIYVATGFAKWGMTNGTSAARIISDSIANHPNPYKHVFTPSRHLSKGRVKSFAKENMDVAKEFIKGKVHKSDKTLEELYPDEGGHIRFNGKKAGAYKNTEGHSTIVDPTCTHMGCDLQWNNGERTWDCPCHGSRFTAGGEVIEGPATKPLKKIDE